MSYISDGYVLYVDVTGSLCMQSGKSAKEVTGVSEVCLHLLFLIK